MRRLRGDAGTIAPLVPVFAFIMLLLGGLVIDASRLLNARGRAVAFAEEAARAGASAIRAGQTTLQLDEPAMRARIDAYCDAVKADPAGGVTYCAFESLSEVGDGDSRRLVVEVLVRLQIPASLLGMVGVDTLRASAVGSARPYEGVDPRDIDSSPPPVVVDPDGPGLDDPPPQVGVDILEPPTPSPVPSVPLPSAPVSIPPSIVPSVPPVVVLSPPPSLDPQPSPQPSP